MVFVDGAKLINVDREDPRHKVPVLGTVKINEPHLLEMVPRVVNLQTYRGRNLVRVKPHGDVLRILLNSPDVKDYLPVLRGVVGTPFMREDGTICNTQGYDEASGVWLQTPLDVSIPENPTREQAAEALGLLRDLLVEMHFAEAPTDDSVGVNEAVALAAMMGVVLRPAFEACPATIINGTAAGAGKSYFTKLLGVLATGKDPAMLSWPKRSEELDKLLDSLLFDGVSMIAFDNANGVKVGGQKICSVVSESEIAGRFLGETRSIRLPTRSTSLVINGNRVEAREDFAARAMTMQLAPNVVIARRERYQYDPLAEVREDRAKYVGAILTIARSFRVHADAPRLTRWAGFGAWSDTVRSALVWLGCPDPLRTTVEAVTQDDELVGVTSLVRAAHAFRPDGTPFKVAEFVAYLTSQPATAQELREFMDPDESHGTQRFGALVGTWFRDRAAGRVVELEDGRLVAIKRHRAGGTNVAKWQVVEITR
jgi:putative DNA primase/helicase